MSAKNKLFLYDISNPIKKIIEWRYDVNKMGRWSPYIIICKEWMQRRERKKSLLTITKARQIEKKCILLHERERELSWAERNTMEKSTFGMNESILFIIIPCSLWSIKQKKNNTRRNAISFIIWRVAHRKTRKNVQVAIKKSQKKYIKENRKRLLSEEDGIVLNRTLIALHKILYSEGLSLLRSINCDDVSFGTSRVV